MSFRTSLPRSLGVLAVAAGGLVLAVPAAASASASPSQIGSHGPPAVHQVNLVSDVPGEASLLDPDLVNPWGLALGAASPLWSANNGTDTSTLYTSAPGASTAAKVPTVRVTLPGAPALPTGQVANAGNDFVLSNGTTSGPARFIFSTLTGRIEAWAPGVDPSLGAAEIKDTVAGAAYTGLALATGAHGDQLYAANFGQNRIDVFDSTFHRVATPAQAFTDRRLPTGFAPFNVQQLDGNVFVTYAKVDPSTGEDSPGRGLGFVDEYTPDGALIARVASGQTLNAPWGLAITPSSWGQLAGALLVGNFGDGKVNVITRHGNGPFTLNGQLRDTTGRALVIPKLWTLLPGTATTGGTDSIWFSAGIDDEQHGLIGVLRLH
jgi:uncharacterized protein (TIGR03118 family)